jgi:His/Glu/Gln/Arg/opine family amino acid ABC transporter permease subunit
VTDHGPPGKAELWVWRGMVVLVVCVAAWRGAMLDWARIAPSWRFLLLALGRSWWLAVIALSCGFAGSVPLAVLRTYGGRWLQHIAVLLIESVRALPELMVVFWIYFSLPVLTGSDISSWAAAEISLTVIAAAHLAEVIRGGLLAVPIGQREAATALGLSRIAIVRLIVLPQALRTMAPALVAQFIALFKTTSLAYAIGVMEFFRAVTVTNNAVYAPYPLYLLLAAGYFVSCWGISTLARWLEVRRGLPSADGPTITA